MAAWSGTILCAVWNWRARQQKQGPYTLIYDGPNADEWAGLEAERAIVASYLAD